MEQIKNEHLTVEVSEMGAELQSTNGQLQWIITEALRKARRLPKGKKGGDQ